MKRMFKKILMVNLMIFMLVYPGSTNAETNIETTPSHNSLYNLYEYVIDSYDVNIIVNENNTFDITETITANFLVPKHGIYRNIPLKNEIRRLDGSTSTNKVKIKNIQVDNKYTTSNESNNYVIKIGSEKETIIGEQKYVIQYNYDIGKDPLKEIDEFYYNIIGTDWDTVIGNITFTIKMPKEFDTNKLGFSSGSISLTDNGKINYNIDDNAITGSYNGILEIGEGLTIRAELPEGYFVNTKLTHTKLTHSITDYLIYVIPVIFLGLSILLWRIFGKDNKVVETVEFYPPQGLNSLEVGFLYKGKSNTKHVTSLLIYLANKGYIKISEIEEKTLLGKKKSFKITKVKEYDGENENERMFLEGLFKKQVFSIPFISVKQKENNTLKEVKESDLYSNFYKTMNKIISNTIKKENKNKIFEKKSSNKSVFFILMIMITFCVITIPPMIEYNESDILLATLFPAVGFSLMFALLLEVSQISFVNWISNNSPFVTKIFGLIIGGIFGFIPWLYIVYPVLQRDLLYLIGYLIGIICTVGMLLCLKYLPKRTQYGNEMLGKIKGFKNFLEVVEKERLEAMVMENPTYFYDILPYTYVLGVFDKWIKKFKSIELMAPEWYDSPAEFSFNSFSSFIDLTLSSVQSAMSSMSPDDYDGGSSGGGSGGGGSSGGGSGGGGSW